MVTNIRKCFSMLNMWNTLVTQFFHRITSEKWREINEGYIFKPTISSTCKIKWRVQFWMSDCSKRKPNECLKPSDVVIVQEAVDNSSSAGSLTKMRRVIHNNAQLSVAYLQILCCPVRERSGHTSHSHRHAWFYCIWKPFFQYAVSCLWCTFLFRLILV